MKDFTRNTYNRYSESKLVYTRYDLWIPRVRHFDFETFHHRDMTVLKVYCEIAKSIVKAIFFVATTMSIDNSTVRIFLDKKRFVVFK